MKTLGTWTGNREIEIVEGRRETDRSQWLEWRTVFTVLGSRRNHFRNWIWHKRRWTLCPTGLQTDRQR